MSQTDSFYLPNSSGAAFRALLNRILEALSEQNAGSTEPSDPFPGMLWLDTSSKPNVLKIRNDANTGWDALFTTQRPPSKVQVGLGNVPNYPATSSISDGSTAKFLLAKAAKDLNDQKLGKSATAADASKLGGVAANAYARSSGTYSGLRAQATTKADVDLGNVQNYGITSGLTSNNSQLYLSAKAGYDLNQTKVSKTFKINGITLQKDFNLTAANVGAIANNGGNLNGTLNYLPDTGTIIALDGKPALRRTTLHGGLSLGCDEGVIIACGEARNTIEANIDKRAETLYLGSDYTVQVITNVQKGWANRRISVFEQDGGFKPANPAKTRHNLQIPSSYPTHIVGELAWFTMETAPKGFLVLNGARIVNGRLDFPALATCGSRFVTISGNDLILANACDFIRGKGNSGRAVGSFEGDAIRNITGGIYLISESWYVSGFSTGCFRKLSGYGAESTPQSPDYSYAGAVELDASLVVPTASENRPKSLTALLCIYTGVI